jgi:alcohol dehydrogenase
MPRISRKNAERAVKKKSPASATVTNGAHDFLSFDHQQRTRIIYGPGASLRIGELSHELAFRRVLLVTDAGIVRAGHAGKIRASLESKKIDVVLFDGVRENPTTEDVDACVAVARMRKVDAVIGLGGGSSMDTAKGCNFILTNGGRMRDYWGISKASRPMLPFIAIPTTAGTGSECQSFALIADEVTHQKMACGDFKAAAKIAILDPFLTISQPDRVTACTGLDAISHAIETAVTLKRSAVSSMYSREAFKLCFQNFPLVLANPRDVESRGKMLLGAALAGAAIEASMLGAAHSTANPLTSCKGIIHGHAVGIMLPHVIRFNSADATSRKIYIELAGLVDASSKASIGKAKRRINSEPLAEGFSRLLVKSGMPVRLRDCGVGRSDLPGFARSASKQWTAAFNPRPLALKDFIALYTAAF